MKKITRLPFLLIVLFLLFPSGFNYSQQLTATLSSNPVTVGETFQLSFTFSSDNVNDISSFQPPSLKDFIVLSGPNQSTSFQWINGQSSASKSFSYYLQAKEKGKFNISPAEITFRGKKINSKGLVIEVAQGQQQGKQQGRQPQTQDAQQNVAESVFIRATADRSTVYVGEQITVTYKLYTALRISNPQISKLPQYQGFWAEEIAGPGVLNFTQEVINGRQFHSAVLKKAALFPTQSGSLSVTPFTLKIPVVVERKRRSNSFFDDFFDDPFAQNQMVEHEAVSNQLSVKVLPLPSGAPPEFNGAVGRFTMSVSADKRKVKQNEPITLKIAFSGTGNLQLLSAPEFELTANLEKYDPKVSDEISREGVIGGKKVFEYLIVPRLEGQYEVPAIRFSYFDPMIKQYKTISSEAIPVAVEKGEGGFVSGRGAGNGRGVEVIDKDIRFIKSSDAELQRKGERFYNSVAGWTLFAIPFLSVIAALVITGRNRKLQLNPEMLRNKKAERLAKSKLKAALSELRAQNAGNFYGALFAGLTGYAENKFNIARSDFSSERLLAAMREIMVPEDVVLEYDTILTDIEYARFAPNAVKTAQMEPLYRRTVQVIVKTENETNKIRRSR